MTTPAPCVADLPSMEAAVPCDWPDCAAPATHRVVLRPCGHGGPMCLPHAACEVLGWDSECRCLRCDITLVGVDMLDL